MSIPETFEPVPVAPCPHLRIVEAETGDIFLCKVKAESYCEHEGDETSCNHYNDIFMAGYVKLDKNRFQATASQILSDDQVEYVMSLLEAQL